MAKKLVCGKSFRIKEQHQSKSAITGRRFQTKEISSTQNEKIGNLPQEAVYLNNLKRQHSYYSLSSEMAFAIAGCNDFGQLTKSFCVVQKLMFHSKTSSEKQIILLCSCEESMQRNQRLIATDRYISESLDHFYEREKSLYCIHIKCLNCLFPTAEINHLSETIKPCTDILSIKPFLVGVCDGYTHGLIHRSKVGGIYRYQCTTCSSSHQCAHIHYFNEWIKEHDIDEEIPEDEQSTQEGHVIPKAISYQKIPYPLAENLRQLHSLYESGVKGFPETLIPIFKPEQKCEHGNHYDNSDPVSSGWVSSAEVIIYKYATTIVSSSRKAYYRPAIGCACKVFYDGQDDLLFNFDNKHFFYYGMFFQYLHLMIEGKNPLAAFHRSSSRCRSILDTHKPPSLKTLRSAWNAFVRLLDVNFSQTFQCPSCEIYPEVIICDGTSIGFRKDLISATWNIQEMGTLPSTNGSLHNERVFIRSTKGRELLLKYSGFTKDRKKLTHEKLLSSNELHTMLSLIEQDSKALAKLITHIQNGKNDTVAPIPYNELFAELARNSPVCGTFQYCGNEDVIKALKSIIDEQVNIFDSANHATHDLLQRYTPLLCSFFNSYYKVEGKSISLLVADLIKEILQCMVAPHTVPQPSSCHYLPVQADSLLSFFPSLPQLIGRANYSADKTTTKTSLDECRKYSGNHPILTPGIFTIFCPHGVCYGYEVMSTNESPYHPFHILRSRFKVAPKLVIYDNACKLHQYCLNREPAFFKHTQFAVDRFHWKGHIGCSSGYCLDKYQHPQLKAINSQINEQANSNLQHIKGQLAYMSVENFKFTVSLFLAIKNQDLHRKITGPSITDCK